MGGEGASGPGLGRSAQAEIDRLADSSVYLFDIPAPWKTGLACVPLSLLLGLYFLPFDPDRWFIDWPLYSIVFFAAPAWLAALFSHAYLRLIGGKTLLYRTMLLALVNLVIIGVVLIPGKAVEVYLDIPRAAVLLFAYSVLVLINHLGNLMTATSRGGLALPATLAQPVAGYVPILFSYYYVWETHQFFVGWELPVLAFIFVASFLGAAHTAMYIGTRPLHLTYGISGVDVFRAFLDHWTNGGEAGRPELEEFFKIFAEPVHATTTVVRFREHGSGDAIATWVVPSIHPGPWGQIGASDLPARMARFLGDGHGEVLTFHGASDHDLNPITHAEVDRIMRTSLDAAVSIEQYGTRASPFLRRADGFDACAQAFNGTVVAVHTSSPSPTDDVDGATGFAIERELEAAGAEPGVFVDAHNCLAPGVGGVSFGTPKSRKLAEMLAGVAGDGLEGQEEGLRAGIGHVRRWQGTRSLGPMGVQATVVEVGGQRMAWVLIDGNNVVGGLREDVRERLLTLVDEAEVFTTDNHVVNVMVGGFNPVGLKDDRDAIIEHAAKAVEAAIEDLRDAEVGGRRAEVGDVMVFGRGNTIRMSSAINSAVATAKGALPAAFAMATAISALAIYILGPYLELTA